MRNAITTVALIAILLNATLGMAANTSTSTFRCGRELARVGESRLEVLLKCGEPTLREETGSEFSPKVDKWYYNCGRHKFIQILTFKSGILDTIKRGKYGKGQSDCIGAERRQLQNRSQNHP